MCNLLKYGLLLVRFKVVSLGKLKHYREGLSKKLGYRWCSLGEKHCKSLTFMHVQQVWDL